MKSNYDIIEGKIQQFLRKYYINKIVIGIIISFIAVFILFIALILIENRFYLTATEKRFIIPSFVLLVGVMLFFLVVSNILKLFGLIKQLKFNSINEKIASHFPQIQDKLLNIIELESSKVTKNVSDELVIASLNQKINSIAKIDFRKALTFKDIKRLFYWFAFVTILTLTFVLVKRDTVDNSFNRLIQINSEFVKPSPYSFEILNNELKVGKGDDYLLKVKVISTTIFENVFINFGGHDYLMKALGEDLYSFEFTNINSSVDFSFKINGILSEYFNLNVLSKPLLASFSVTIKSPHYTGIKDVSYSNLTELIVPVGSRCIYTFDTYYTDAILIDDSNEIKSIKRENKDVFIYELFVKENKRCTVGLLNENYIEKDVLQLNIALIDDDFPEISVNQIVDSTELTRMYFKGSISDDYGFNDLKFVVSSKGFEDTIYYLNILKNLNEQDFFYAFDFSVFKDKSELIEYYFEVTDNDKINGQKSAVSEFFVFKFPDLEEKLEKQKEDFENIEELLANSRSLTKDIQSDLFDMQQKLLNNELSEWERKEAINHIISKKQSLEKTLEDIQNKNQELNNYMKSFSEQGEKIAEKQEMIQKLLEDVFSDELKKLMDEFNKMMEKFNENSFNKMNDEMEISLDDLSEQLDKNLELLRKMQIEDRLNTTAEELKKAIDKQDKLLANDTQDNESKINEQKDLNEILDKLKKEYNNIRDENEKLKTPLNLFDFQKDFDDIKGQNENTLEQLDKGKNKRAKDSMQQSKEKMEALAFMMQQMMDAAFSDQSGENLADLLQILDNLVIFSFSQERIINEPDLLESDIHMAQRNLQNDFEVISDSLYALAEREPSIGSMVNKEMVAIKTNFSGIEFDLSEDRLSNAKVKQQRVLTSSNELALFMSEVIKNMQQQMASSKPGNQNCEKPGNNPNPKSGMQSLKSMQKSLQQQLEGMMQMMKDGQKSGNMNSEMGKALSQQEMMQRMISQMMNQGNVGSDAYETLKMAEQLLNNVRQDILRNNVSNNTIKRQKDIMTRLLEAENAENERDIDEKRKSNTAEEQKVSETAKFFDNSISNDNFEERLIKNKLLLKRYYQRKYQNYVNQLDSINERGN